LQLKLSKEKKDLSRADGALAYSAVWARMLFFCFLWRAGGDWPLSTNVLLLLLRESSRHTNSTVTPNICSRNSSFSPFSFLDNINTSWLPQESLAEAPQMPLFRFEELL
jgi:hypothetical protein